MSELGVLYWMQGISTPALDSVMIGITYSATSAVLWFVLAFVMTCTRRYRRVGVAVIVSVLFAYVLVDLIIKPAVDRPRPFDVGDFHLLVAPPETPSFPSGHTASSFAAATAILLYRRSAGVLAMAYATLVGLSRIYLCVHWPTDVVAGAVIGVAASLLVIWAMGRWVPFFRDLPDPRVPGDSPRD